jgi:hypothetical protein
MDFNQNSENGLVTQIGTQGSTPITKHYIRPCINHIYSAMNEIPCVNTWCAETN